MGRGHGSSLPPVGPGAVPCPGAPRGSPGGRGSAYQAPGPPWLRSWAARARARFARCVAAPLLKKKKKTNIKKKGGTIPHLLGNVLGEKIPPRNVFLLWERKTLLGKSFSPLGGENPSPRKRDRP